jgi:hypothetical protein
LYPPIFRVLVPALLVGLVLIASCSDDDTTAPVVPEPPTILGQHASDVDHQGVTLGGWVDGHGRSTICWFDYGSDITYGSRTPDLDAGAIAGSMPVEQNLMGLDPDTLHWWRLVAVSGDDTTFAADTTFTTLMIPNEPPMTHAVGNPMDNNPVQFFWTGNDPDGYVVGFLWRISDNGLDNGVDVADTLGLPWHFTTVTDSSFAVSADQPIESPGPKGIGKSLFAQNHTFWIKAVDNLGAEDPSPAFIAFTAISEAPEVAVDVTPAGGPMPDGCLEVSLPAIFTWTASDPDSPADAVLEVRTLLVSLSDLGFDACLTQGEYEGLDPLAMVDEALWSDWQEYDPLNHLQPALGLGPEHVGGRFLFAAMARDAAGAWTRELTWGGNVWQVEVLPD